MQNLPTSLNPMPRTYPDFRCLANQGGLLTAFLGLCLVTILSNAASEATARTALTHVKSWDERQKIQLGIDVLAISKFRELRGKRVGLLTHPAGVNRQGVSTIEVLRGSPHVHLVALFGPEHGIYGNEKANVPVASRIDPLTKLPTYSLYGQYRKPTPAMLAGLDILVIDLQDIGVRSYTYVSAMRLAMEACFEQRIEVMILDRPNPLGGFKVDGPLLDQNWRSYVGAFNVPYVHGLTIGELALMAKKIPGWLKVSEKVRRRGILKIIRMQGWSRDMMWPDTGLGWVATSPAIPDLSAALGYSMTGLGAQIGGFRHGYGTRYPFRLLSYPGKSVRELKKALRGKSIPGLDYKYISYTGKNGKTETGLYLKVSNWENLRPTEISFVMMQLACEWNTENPFAKASQNSAGLFTKHVGSVSWWDAICTDGADVEVQSFIVKWQKQARSFQVASRKYWLYE